MGLNKTIMTRKMLGENMNRFLPKHEPKSTPICSYCDEELDGPTTNGIHDRCFNHYMEMEYPERISLVGAVDE